MYVSHNYFPLALHISTFIINELWTRNIKWGIVLGSRGLVEILLSGHTSAHFQGSFASHMQGLLWIVFSPEPYINSVLKTMWAWSMCTKIGKLPFQWGPYCLPLIHCVALSKLCELHKLHFYCVWKEENNMCWADTGFVFENKWCSTCENMGPVSGIML